MRYARIGVLGLVVSHGVVAGQDAAPPDVRFDELIRADYFAGLLRGDEDAWARARGLVEATLAGDPDRAEAIAWGGAMDVADSGKLFEAGDFRAGMALYEKGVDGLDRAVRLAPLHPGTRIPRATTFLAVAQHIPEPQVRHRILVTAVEDLETSRLVVDVTRLSEHARGELLLGLADGYLGLGLGAEAALALDEIERDLAGTRYAERAAAMRGRLEEAAAATDRGAPAPGDGARRAELPLFVELARGARAGGAVSADLLAQLIEAVAAGAEARAQARQALGQAPEGPERLAWKAVLEVYESGELFERGDFARAMPLWTSGLEALDEAASTGNAWACLLRCGTLLDVARHDPDPGRRAEMTAKAKADYETIAGSDLLAPAGMDRLGRALGLEK